MRGWVAEVAEGDSAGNPNADYERGAGNRTLRGKDRKAWHRIIPSNVSSRPTRRCGN